MSTFFRRTLSIIFCVLAIGSVRAGETQNLFNKISLLALKGSPEAHYHLGMMHNNGIGTEKDLKKALEQFQKAAKMGDPLGAYKLGCYYDGQAGNLLQTDHEKSLNYKRIAADAGYVLAQHDVGILLYKKKDWNGALRYWKMAAQQGDAESTYFISNLYSDGSMLPKNLTLAYSYFKLSQLLARKEITKNAQKSLDEISSKISKTEKEKAEKIVSNWEIKKTLLTIKAAQGLNAAEALANSP